MSNATLYDRDFYAWSQEQAALLRSGNVSDADLEHIAEEIESMGKTEKRELTSRLIVLLSHLLKWQYQPGPRGASWEVTISNQRSAITRHLADNPSLKSLLSETFADAYADARREAYAQTGLPKAMFPMTSPWSFEQIMDEEFWPEA